MVLTCKTKTWQLNNVRSVRAKLTLIHEIIPEFNIKCLPLSQIMQINQQESCCSCIRLLLGIIILWNKYDDIDLF